MRGSAQSAGKSEASRTWRTSACASIAPVRVGQPRHASAGGAAAGPSDGFFKGGDFDKDEASDELLELGEGTVDYGLLVLGGDDACGLGGGAKPLAGEEHAGLSHVFVVLADGCEEVLVGEGPGFHVCVGFADDHEAHWVGLLEIDCKRVL